MHSGPREYSTAENNNNKKIIKKLSWVLCGFQDLAVCHQLKILLGDRSLAAAMHGACQYLQCINQSVLMHISCL